jgi:hypothetical protein
MHLTLVDETHAWLSHEVLPTRIDGEMFVERKEKPEIVKLARAEVGPFGPCMNETTGASNEKRERPVPTRLPTVGVIENPTPSPGAALH